jgi:hypothetical protein
VSERGGIRTGLEERKNTSKPSFFSCFKAVLSSSTSGHYYNANQAAAGKYTDITRRNISYSSTATEIPN